ncbi:hypothetical protein BV898_02383 [Hypsibius exemplaris]|uniref:G-protein coupled receptors family 1 profile domain-containing protein n=1 Tax=Hypsibius exemplaris TaxID=2072580 RepID=A0A1W0X8D0_HYPEX|nr:hypothetical protein BV898_02383 [Hypsibius exemplaris]
MINVFGAIANGLLLAATLTYRPLRNSTACILLAHCILVDLFITLCTEPGLILVTYFGPDYIPPNFCQAWGGIMFGFVFVDNWSHTVLAINRFIAAIFPHQYKQVTTKRTLVMAVVFPWLISILLNFFPTAKIGMTYDALRS